MEVQKFVPRGQNRGVSIYEIEMNPEDATASPNRNKSPVDGAGIDPTPPISLMLTYKIYSTVVNTQVISTLWFNSALIRCFYFPR